MDEMLFYDYGLPYEEWRKVWQNNLPKLDKPFLEV